jgi:hypothetical protein
MRVSSPQLSACRSSSILSRIGIPYCPISAIEGFAERDLSRRPGTNLPDVKTHRAAKNAERQGYLLWPHPEGHG